MYINTDLELTSDHDLASLAASLQSRAIFALHLARDDRHGWRATFETTTQHHDPEANISAFLDAIESLTAADAELWQGCSRREFNIGYECRRGPGPALVHVLSTQLLARLVAAGAVIGFTIYQVDDTTSREL